jgi:hypothetical protein
MAGYFDWIWPPDISGKRTYVIILVLSLIRKYGYNSNPLPTSAVNKDYDNGVPTSQETHCVSAPNRSMLLREIIAVYCENHTEHINTLCGQNAGFFQH